MERISSENRIRLFVFFLISLIAALTDVVIADDIPMPQVQPADSNDNDTVPNLKYPIKDQSNTPFNQDYTPMDLDDPSNIKKELIYDPETGKYYYKQKLGNSLNYRPENYMTFDEYRNYKDKEATSKYWSDKVAAENEFNKEGGFEVPDIKVENKTFDRIFGGNTIDIRPSGSAELIFGVNVSKTENPALPERQRRISTFDFDQRIQLNVIGNIGDKLKLTTNYNTEATFSFENQVKLDYTAYEDDIIQKIEAGNISMPLNSTLIQGSQSLFGFKTQLKFGRLTVTPFFSQQRGKKKNITVEGGAQVTEFEIKADNYEDNKHFFVSHFFRDNYEDATSSPPYVTSKANITKIEVWVTNTNNRVQNVRNILAFQDLGESNRNRLYDGSGNVQILSQTGVDDNRANSLYENVKDVPQVRQFLNANQYLDGQGYEARVDYHKVGLARKLDQSEFTYHPQLGYISVNQKLQPNQVLAVAFQYSYQGRTYQVGEFSTDVNGDQPLMLKMLKSTELRTDVPMWDLMMKNVYSLSAYQVQSNEFKLNVWYLDRDRGVETNFIDDGPADVNGRPLIQVLGLDKLDVNKKPNPDGVFDFLTFQNQYVPTINPDNGRIYFPTLEPFGQTIREKMGTKELGDLYAFDSLYTVPREIAKVSFPDKNRFTIKGEFQSSSSNEIALNALNVPEGSVKVTAGGRELVENQDYTVDYTLGRVKILNEGLLESGTPINISLESNASFNVQTQTLFGSRFDYKVSEDLMFGGTIMNLTERPVTRKTNVYEEPMSNTVYGLDGTYRTDAPFLTKFVDNIPFLDTKEKSSIQVSGEFAQLIPGHNKAIGDEGSSYIDDFEGSQTTIDLRSRTMWSLASVPQGQPDLFPEAELTNNLATNFNRALLAWYTIDPLFWRNDARTPDHIADDEDMQSNHFMRQVPLDEVFPNRQAANAQFNNIPTFDLAFYPSEKGPYNYDVDGTDRNGNQYGFGVEQGANGGVRLKRPERRWAGIQRPIIQQDFNSANVEYIQFWVMDPFNEDYEYGSDNGKLYINLGTISEDIQKDGQIIYENLIDTEDRPANRVLTEQYTSAYGRFTPGQRYVNGFDNNPDARNNQDIGLDGLRNDEEQVFFESYINELTTLIPGANVSDPSSDDFLYYQGDELDNQQANILERYKYFNNHDGNSPIAGQSGDAAIGSTRPDAEDINDDNNLDDIENYWQYSVDISPQEVNPNNVGDNYITDMLETTVTTTNGQSRNIRWYQFRIPLDEGTPIGNIKDFRSIRFMRMFMRGFSNPVVMRFARLELVRGEWRRFDGSLQEPGDYLVEDENTEFVVQAVNFEENSERTPVNYVIPPDIEREINIGTTNQQQLNEQSLEVAVCDLKDGEARAAYRQMDLDLLSYGKIKMFVHGESRDQANPIENDEVTVFMRLGTDFENNYYEYEIPLKITPPGVYNSDDDAAKRRVWPEANNFEVDFDALKRAKTNRNRTSNSNPNSVNNQSRFEYNDGKATIYVKGNPNLATVKTIMIGIRNPKAQPGSEDDGMPKCATVWFNELRLSEFNDQAGWAAIGRMNAQLADFATVAVSGQMSTPGWGTIEQKVSERQRETIQQFDVSSNMSLGKFFGKKSGIKIPAYVGYQEYVSRPQFAPLAPDIEFDDYVNESYPDGDKQDSVRRVQETRRIRRSVNLTNVRKEKTNPQKKSRFYDISNFSATLSYSEDFERDFNTEYDRTKRYRGGITYNHSFDPENIKPFNKINFLRKSKYLRLIRDFNFYLLPKQVSFSTNFDRRYNERKVRNNQPDITADMPPFYNKSFNWNRNYSMRWDLTRSLKLDFQANNQALIEEPRGAVNKDVYAEQYDQWKDSVWTAIKDFGTNTRYNHQIGLNYSLPLSKIPALDWINSSARYNATYNWDRAPFAADSLGNTIQNTRQVSINASFNFLSLYNKVKFLREINRKAQLAQREKQRDQRGRGRRQTQNDTTDKKDDNKLSILEHAVKSLMMFKNASASYSRNQGVMLPGYSPEHRILGMNPNFSAPGAGFIVGQQDNFGDDGLNFLDHAQQKGWLVQEDAFNQMYSETYSERFNYRLTMEPVKDLRVELTGNYDESRNFSTYNRWYDTLIYEDGTEAYDLFNRESPITTGNFSRTFFSFPTSFIQDNDQYVNEAFQNFSDFRTDVSRRLSAENPYTSPDTEFEGDSVQTSQEFYQGYGPTHPEVLIPAFMAAYSGKEAKDVNLNPFSKTPMPNWRLTYTGLSKLKALKKWFKSVTLSHAYQSTFSIASYRTNILYEDPEGVGFTSVRDPVNGVNIVPQNEYRTVTIQESFSPLINIDMSWKNSLITRFEVRFDRSLSLSIANAQITETRGQEYTVGLGYTFDQIKIPFTLPSKQDKIKSDLRTRADFSIRNNYTILRKLETDVRPNEPTGGQRIMSIKLTADYSLSKNLNIRLFFDRVVNTPVISLAYPTANTNAGLSIRFTITG
ncbi:cell surface protein SprA [Salibacter sp.]|uniref:T9SS outer membrane translocon Sov/SprA n=1 Tax=Salibacter sp. TaxID=2010995 RepID=UPI00286FFE0D|nr:cell surface protein SprA [Salibacter sp.]MDR9486872.1 cell surface protein SprA [Salibacter sp.]